MEYGTAEEVSVPAGVGEGAHVQARLAICQDGWVIELFDTASNSTSRCMAPGSWNLAPLMASGVLITMVLVK